MEKEVSRVSLRQGGQKHLSYITTTATLTGIDEAVRIYDLFGAFVPRRLGHAVVRISAVVDKEKDCRRFDILEIFVSNV